MSDPSTFKTAFITGASSGIGEELARQLARDGTEVVLAARRKDLLDRIADDIRGAGGRARTVELDVASPAEVEAAVRRADDEVGGLDLVIANAGIGKERWSGKLKWEDCLPLIQVNVHGAVATLTGALDRMVERKRGHLVGISSLAQYRGLPRNAVYSATKAFLSTLLEGMRVDLKSVGIAVTDVRPGFVRTPMTAVTKHPMPFMVEVADAGALILNGIKKRQAVVAFPWQLATLVRSASILPAAVYDRAVARARG